MLGNITRQVYYVNPGETLTGTIVDSSGRRYTNVSDLEERSVRALVSLRIPFRFRLRINPLADGGITEYHYNTSGEVELDLHTKYRSVVYPFMIQGEIAHFYAAYQKIVDLQKVTKINNFLKAENARKAILIPFTLLDTQEHTNNLYGTGFASGWPVEFQQL